MALGTALLSASSDANPAVIADPFAPSQFSLGLLRTAGWRLTVGAELSVTHLGVYDWQANGLEIDYPVGLWNSAGDLLTTTTVPGGLAATYVHGFRYVPTAPTILVPGETYTIGYFQNTLAGSDRAIYFDGFHQYDPLVSQSGDAVINEGSPGLAMPDQLWVTGFQYWLGPSFQYTIVPAPSAGALLVLALMRGRSRQRN